MKKLWLVFAQTVTVVLAIWFVIVTLKPQWLQALPPHTTQETAPQETPQEAPASTAEKTPEAAMDQKNIASVETRESYRSAVQEAAPAVVSINTSKEVRHPRSNDPWFQFFFGARAGSQIQSGLGSGVIVSPKGYILTNNHVVANADDIQVVTANGRKAQARLIGTDPETDLAVLHVDLSDLPSIHWGNSDAIEVGDKVLAIGNPFGVGQTVTSGIVSALRRDQLGVNTFENFIQTDAAINPGNSGGALVDVHGHLLGINSAIYSRSGGSLGIGFAIPASIAKQVMDAILRDGKVTRGWIGIETADMTPELASTFGVERSKGALVTGVLQAAPAARAGLLPGDIIIRIAHKEVNSASELLTFVAMLKPGDTTPLEFVRSGKPAQTEITPDERPAPPQPTQRP